MAKWFKLVLATAVAVIMVLSVPLSMALTSNDSSKSLRSGVLTTGPDEFVYATIGEPDYLDPAVDYETSGGQVLQNVYENLIWYDGSSAITFKPVLATEIPTVGNGLISADGLNYTFNLRSGVTFHDGTAMNADDVVYSIQRVLRIHDPTGPSWMLEQVLTDYVNWYVGDTIGNYLDSSFNATWIRAVLQPLGWDHVITEDDVKTVAEAAVLKVNDLTVKFRLTHPYPGFLAITAYTVCSIVSKDFVEANGGVVGGEHNSYMDVQTCGTGPYELVDWNFGVQIDLTRYDGYWGTLPAIRDVHIVQVNDYDTRILMLQVGDADSAIIGIANESLFTGPDFSVVKGLPTFDITFAGFNMNINTTAAALYGSNVPGDFFQNVHVRNGFVHLLNYTQFITDVLNDNAVQPNGPIPKGMFGYDASVPAYDYNLTAAEQELKAAINPATGHTWWVDGFTVAFMYNAGNNYRQAACVYMKDSLESLGLQFHATINAFDWPTYLWLLRSSPSPFPMFYFGWAPDYADPDDYCNPFLLTDSYFPIMTEYSNATIDALVRSASVELDPTVRAAMYSEITWLTHNDTPYIWLYQSNNFHVERSWVDGYYFNPMYSGLYFPALSKTPSVIPEFGTALVPVLIMVAIVPIVRKASRRIR
jgi:peptide/nickel transport system substrate-binding protein